MASEHDTNLNGRVFGGQLLAQVLLAAQHESEGLPATLHALFLQGAEPTQPLHYDVEILQKGRRFTSCHVRGHQFGKRVVDAQITFQQPMAGYEHAVAAPEVADPETLLPLSQLCDAQGNSLAWLAKPGLELRLLDSPDGLAYPSAQPSLRYWVKLALPLDDQAMHYAALAYLSDYWINGAAIGHHVPLLGAREALYVASLNHSLWFHRPCVADDWILFVCDSPSLQCGRGLTWARLYDRQRRLLASISQDALIGPRTS
ncbi:thioesterase family protein [Pseudomonas silvicola]|nr:thioesterase family protein [Pseudomonas silvicola]